jgi:hypothetical protein
MSASVYGCIRFTWPKNRHIGQCLQSRVCGKFELPGRLGFGRSCRKPHFTGLTGRSSIPNIYDECMLWEPTMTALTEEEVRQFFAKNECSTGIKTGERTLRYDDPEANAFHLKFPETPLRATYFSRLVSMLGAEDESMFYGALLWITLSNIGSPQLEKLGGPWWK